MQTFQNFHQEDYNFSRNLFFYGNVGVGKTYTMREIVKRYKNDQQPALLWSYEISDGHFKQLIQNNMLKLRRNDEYYTSIDRFPLEMMLRVDVLFYDDLGYSDTSDAYVRYLTYILDERMKKNRINLFTSNFKESELKDKLNERILSRVFCNCDVVWMQ